jgi:putative ABC transport system substrate-binding protein
MRAAWAMLARDPASSAGTGVLGAIQTAAASIGVDVRPIGSDDTTAIERGVAAFASRANGGLVVPATALASLHRELIIELATRYRLPAVYPNREFVTGGGRASYGYVRTDLYRRVARFPPWVQLHAPGRPETHRSNVTSSQH